MQNLIWGYFVQKNGKTKTYQLILKTNNMREKYSIPKHVVFFKNKKSQTLLIIFKFKNGLFKLILYKTCKCLTYKLK